MFLRVEPMEMWFNGYSVDASLIRKYWCHLMNNECFISLQRMAKVTDREADHATRF
jgi:hypothetical protein